MKTFTGCLRDLVAVFHGDQMMGRSGDVCGTWFIHYFSAHKHIKLFLTVTPDFIVICSSEKFSEQCSDQKNNLSRNYT